MDIRIVKGGPEDLGIFADLLIHVWQEMPEKDWFYLDSAAEYQTWMDRDEMHLWLAMDGDVAAGALDILIPGLHRDNYGYLLNLPPEQLMQVVNMDAAAVLPSYRGRGIQRRLLQAAEEWLGQEEDRILLCTIHPDNRFSLQNALAQGYEIQKQIPIYGSLRYLLKKEIQKMKNKC